VYGAALDVGAGAHGLGGADEDGYVAVAGVGEDRGLVAVVLGGLHEADLLGGDAGVDEAVAEGVVGVVVGGLGGGYVAEHDLEGAGGGGRKSRRLNSRYV